ncbi:hypothetical protein BX070DRAFT_229484, partial [Coemansia spiralis]
LCVDVLCITLLLYDSRCGKPHCSMSNFSSSALRFLGEYRAYERCAIACDMQQLFFLLFLGICRSAAFAISEGKSLASFDQHTVSASNNRRC